MPAEHLPRRERHLAALAAKWRVDAVGRDKPDRDNLHISVAARQYGRWYIIRDGNQVDATPLQATTMDLVVGPVLGSIGPVAATKY
jgi:hypothetical protein